MIQYFMALFILASYALLFKPFCGTHYFRQKMGRTARGIPRRTSLRHGRDNPRYNGLQSDSVTTFKPAQLIPRDPQQNDYAVD